MYKHVTSARDWLMTRNKHRPKGVFKKAKRLPMGSQLMGLVPVSLRREVHRAERDSRSWPLVGLVPASGKHDVD